MPRPHTPSTREETRNTIQSYIVTEAKFKYTLTEERIKNALLNNLWSLTGETKGVVLKENLFRLHKETEVPFWKVEMPVRDILKYMGKETTPEEHKKNQAAIRKAAKSIQTKIFEVWNSATQDYWSASLIMNVHIAFRSGMMTFYVADWVMTALLDLTKGFTQYELDKMQRLTSPFSMRAYELVSNSSKKVLSFTPEEIRTWFGVTDKYKREYDFVKRVLEPSKQELDKICPWSFDYQLIHENPTNDKTEVKLYNIYPKHIPRNESQTIIKNKAIAQLPAGGSFGVLDQHVYDYLLNNLNWTKDYIMVNKQTLLKAQDVLPDIMSDLSYLGAKARTMAKPVGYVINSLKGKIEDTERKTKTRTITEAIANQFKKSID